MRPSPSGASELRRIAQADIEDRFGWAEAVEALRTGHALPRAALHDAFLGRGDDTLLSRSAWVDGLGAGVKSVTVMPGNAARGLPTVQGAMLLFDDADGTPVALVEGTLLTDWKTAADSALGASLLARSDSRRLTILGAGRVAGNLARANAATFPAIEAIAIWNRTPARADALAERLVAEGLPARAVTDLLAAIASADIVSTATMAREPILRGEWVRPGTHVDLVGAFRADMREADDALLSRARLFVDCLDTTIDHIGELAIPLASGAIGREDVLGDLYGLIGGKVDGRRSDDGITVFKNGGGAHLDLMIAHALREAAG